MFTVIEIVLTPKCISISFQFGVGYEYNSVTSTDILKQLINISTLRLSTLHSCYRIEIPHFSSVFHIGLILFSRYVPK